MYKYVLLALVGALLTQVSNALDTSEQRDALKKLEEAVSKTNVFDLRSFQLKATTQIEVEGKPLDGTYRLLWNGPEQWREELTFPGYTELQVGGKGIVWRQRSTDFIPLRIYQLHSALGFGSALGMNAAHSRSFVQLGLTANDRIQKLHSRKARGDQLTCVETENELKAKSEICINDSTGTLFRGASYEDGDFQPVGTKIFPRFLSFVDKGETVAKVKVNEFITSDQFPPNAFVPPVGILGEPGCMNPTPYRQIKNVVAEYPPEARHQQLQGTVLLDVFIGKDGIPIIRKVLDSPGASLEKSSANAIAGWRYEPAACDGEHVQLETVLQVNYFSR